MTDFNVNVGINPSGASRGGATVRRELNQVDDAGKRVEKSLKRAFGLIGGGALLAGGVRLVANFQQEMSTVLAVTGATEKQFNALNAEARRLGETTRFSASEAASGLVFLGRAGFNAEESLSSLEGTLTLAQAGGLGLGRAADIATNVLSGFRLEVSQTSEVVDILAKTANSSNTDVEQLGNAMSFTAPVAAGFGVDITTAAAAIGVLSNNALQGSRAGTGLNKVLTRLETPGSETRKVLDDLGVSMEDVKISQVGLTSALKTLNEAGITAGQGLQAFGDRGGPAFEILVNSIPDVEEMTEKLLGAGGAAKQTADIMDNNLNGALLSVKSAFQGFIINLSQLDDNNAATKFVKDFAGLLRGLSANMDVVGKALTFFGVVILGSLVVKGAVAAAGAIKLLTVAIIANPIGALIVGVTAGIGYLFTFGDTIRVAGTEVATFSDFVTLATKRVQEGFQSLGGLADNVVSTFNSVYSSVVTLLTGTTESSLNSVAGLGNGIGSILGTVLDYFRHFINTIIASFVSFRDFIAVTFTGIFNFFSRLVSELAKVSTAIGKVATGDLQGALDSVKGIEVSNILPTVEEAQASARELNTIITKNFETDFIGDAISTATDFAGLGEVNGQSFGERFVAGFKGTLANIAADLDDIGSRRIAAEEAASAAAGSGASGPAGGGSAQVEQLEEQAKQLTILGDAQSILNTLLKENASLNVLDTQRRGVLNELLAIEVELGRELNAIERDALGTQIEANNQAAIKARLADEIIGVEQDLLLQRQALQQLALQGLDTTRQQIDLDIQLAQTRASQSSTFGQGLGTELQTQVAEAQLAFVELGTTVGEIFGPSGQLATGIADAIAQSIVFGDNFGDSLKQIGKQIAAQLISQLIQVGIQQVVLGTIGQSVIAAQTATLAAAGVSVATAWAPAAAAVSLASFGANTAPALAALTSAFSLSQGLALTSAIPFANGGLVQGPGTGTSDSIRALLSNGEFVVNARSTKQNLPALTAMNNGGSMQSSGANRGSLSIAVPISVEKGSNIDEEYLATLVETRVTRILSEQGQFGGQFGSDE